MKAVLLDAANLGDDIDLGSIRDVVTELTVYQSTAPGQLAERLDAVDLIITNKVKIPAPLMKGRKGIFVLATGTNNIDMEGAERLGVPVFNVDDYGTESVAQHTLMLILALAASLQPFQQDLAAGAWQHSDMFCLLTHPTISLKGKHLVLVGSGHLGQRVAHLAEVLGMQVHFAARPGRADDSRAALDELLEVADVVSFHCPLTDATRHLLNRNNLPLIKPSCLVVNCARGGVIDEVAALEALRDNKIGGLAVDVLPAEPPTRGHPLLDALQDGLNLIVTPHSAWITPEARQKIIELTAGNIRALIHQLQASLE